MSCSELLPGISGPPSTFPSLYWHKDAVSPADTVASAATHWEVSPQRKAGCFLVSKQCHASLKHCLYVRCCRTCMSSSASQPVCCTRGCTTRRCGTTSLCCVVLVVVVVVVMVVVVFVFGAPALLHFFRLGYICSFVLFNGQSERAPAYIYREISSGACPDKLRSPGRSIADRRIVLPQASNKRYDTAFALTFHCRSTALTFHRRCLGPPLLFHRPSTAVATTFHCPSTVFWQAVGLDGSARSPRPRSPQWLGRSRRARLRR